MGAEALPEPALAIVGTVVDDRILLADGGEARGLGGLAYGVAALAGAAGGRRPILPICRADDGLATRLRAAWGGLAGVRLDGLVAGELPCTRVELDYRASGLAAGERVERLLAPVPALRTDELCPRAAGAAAIVVNMITGFDLEIDAFRALPRTAWIMLDVHSLALAREEDGLRTWRPVPAASEWLAGADVIQCNLREAAALTGPEGESSPAVLARRLRAALQAARRPEVALLTLGAEGAILVPAEGEPVHRPVPRRVGGDPTGAGDTLGAAFAASTLDGLDPLEALDRAMAVAANACERSGAGPA